MICRYQCKKGRKLGIPLDQKMVRILISLDESKVSPLCKNCSGKAEVYADDAGGTLVRREYCEFERLE